MAKLPRSPISEGVTNQYRPVREARASGADPVGQAMEQAGNAGFEIASRMADAKIAADAAEASIKLRSRLDEEYRAIENDMEGDPTGFEAKFRERAAAIASEEAGRMSSPAMKRAFGAKSMELTETYSINMRDVTRRRQVEGVKAQTMRIGADYQAIAADPSKPRELLDETKDSYLSLIDQHQKAGIFTPDVAEAARIAAGEVYRSGVTTRHLTNLDDLVDRERFGEAELYLNANDHEMDPAEAQKARDVFETKKREGESVTVADELWDKSGGNYDQFLTMIREDPRVKGTDMLQAVEARGAVRKNQAEAAKDATDQKMLDTGMEYVTTGKSIPASVMRDASPKVRDMLQSEIRTRSLWNQQMATLSAEEKAAIKEASNISKDYLKGFAALVPEQYMAGPSKWVGELNDVWGSLSPEHKGEVLADINTRVAGGGTFNAADVVLKDLIAQIPMIGPANRLGKDFSGDSKSTGDALAEEMDVVASLYRQAQDYAKRTGGAPITPTESKVIIARAFRSVNPELYPQVGATNPGGYLNPIRSRLAVVADLKDMLKRDPTQAEINAAMAATQ
jgi:hypothetical protein